MVEWCKIFLIFRWSGEQIVPRPCSFRWEFSSGDRWLFLYKRTATAKSTKRILSLPRVISFKFPLQPQQKYYITQYGELGFSYRTQMSYDYARPMHKENGACELEVKLYLDFQGVTWPWWRMLTNGSGIRTYRVVSPVIMLTEFINEAFSLNPSFAFLQAGPNFASWGKPCTRTSWGPTACVRRERSIAGARATKTTRSVCNETPSVGLPWAKSVAGSTKFAMMSWSTCLTFSGKC